MKNRLAKIDADYLYVHENPPVSTDNSGGPSHYGWGSQLNGKMQGSPWKRSASVNEESAGSSMCGDRVAVSAETRSQRETARAVSRVSTRAPALRLSPARRAAGSRRPTRQSHGLIAASRATEDRNSSF
jgi:hypothetical protein